MRIENRIKTTQKSLYIKRCATVIAIIHIQIDITVCHRNPFIGDFHHLPNRRRYRRRRNNERWGHAIRRKKNNGISHHNNCDEISR